MRFLVLPVVVSLFVGAPGHGAEPAASTSTGSSQVLVEYESFIGRAYNSSGELVYTEEHKAEFKGDTIVKASTVYKDPSGKKIAELESDFSLSLTAPAHDFKDLRFNLRYGIRYSDKQATMFVQEGSEPEKTKAVGDGGEKLLVGCQGLGYYFRVQLADLRKQGRVPILFLIPGKLDTFNFEMQYKGPDKAGHEIFEIHIKSLVLRLFAPKLVLHYDAKKNRLLRYEGLSNLYDSDRKQQNVRIEYSWD